MTGLQAKCANEPHIKALNQQQQDKGTILLTAAGSELWSAAGKACNDINAEGFIKNSENMTKVLVELDASLTVTK